MVPRYVSFQPPRVAAVSMIEGPRVLTSFSGGWKFRQMSPTHCRVNSPYSRLCHSSCGKKPENLSVFPRRYESLLRAKELLCAGSEVFDTSKLRESTVSNLIDLRGVIAGCAAKA